MYWHKEIFGILAILALQGQKEQLATQLWTHTSYYESKQQANLMINSCQLASLAEGKHTSPKSHTKSKPNTIIIFVKFVPVGV